MKRRFLLWAAMAVMSLQPLAHAGEAPEFPVRPVKLVVPFPPAGGADVVARILSEPLSRALGQLVIIENMPGASGDLGVANVVRSRPDGYTIVLGANTLATNPHLSKLSYDPIQDLVPIGRVASSPLVVVANPAITANHLGELVGLSKSSQSELEFGTPGIATPMHLAGERIRQRTGARLLHVPYRGSGVALTDVLAGHIPLMITSLSPVMEYVKSGRLKAVAVLGSQRANPLPEAPTAIEGGVDGVEAEVWYGFFAPKATPPAVVEKLEAAFRSAALSDAVVRKYEELGLIPGFESSAQLAAILRKEFHQWGDVITATKIGTDR